MRKTRAHTRFPRIARAFTFDLQGPCQKCTHLIPLSRRLILLIAIGHLSLSGDLKTETEIRYLETETRENERKSEKAHTAHARTLLENAVYNEWQFQA